MSHGVPDARQKGVVVAVSGPPGSGKSTLTRSIAARYPGSVYIDWDSYESFTERTPAEIRQWLDEGARPEALAVPGLAERLATLREAHVVFFETPFGRTHPGTARYIDVSIWLDIPLDLALARKLKTLIDKMTTIDWVQDYLVSYQDFVHQALDIQQDRLRSAAELCIDATDSIERVTKAAIAGLADHVDLQYSTSFRF